MKLLTIILFLSYCNIAFSQPLVDGFNKGKNNLDLVGSYTYDSYGKYYAFPGILNVKRNTNVFSFFTAYGITNKWDLQASLPFITTGNESGFQDASIISKFNFYSKTIGNGKLSFLVSNGFFTPASNYQTETLFALGQKATAIDNRLITQYFMNSGLFVMAQSGYSYRFEPVPSSIPVAFKIGLAKSKNYFDFWFDYQNSEKGFSYRDGFRTSLRTLSVSYLKTGFTYYRSITDNLGAALNFANTITGQNVGKSTVVSLAVILKLKTTNK